MNNLGMVLYVSQDTPLPSTMTIPEAEIDTSIKRSAQKEQIVESAFTTKSNIWWILLAVVVYGLWKESEDE
jgi:hypothetical protein